jgi:hypothetical protein
MRNLQQRQRDLRRQMELIVETTDRRMTREQTI